MTKNDAIRHALAACSRQYEFGCENCEYAGMVGCHRNLARDALDRIRQLENDRACYMVQQADADEGYSYKCSKCGKEFIFIDEPPDEEMRFCPKCGCYVKGWDRV